MISTFLLQGGAGTLLAACFVPAAATGRAFNRFVASLAAVILLLGTALHTVPRPADPERVLWVLAIAAAALSAGLSHSGRLRPGRGLLLAGTAASLLGMLLGSWRLASALGGGGALPTLRFMLDGLSSAWLLGSVLVAMILGHYYLNIPGLAIRHLIRLCLLAVAAASLRAILFAWGMFAGGGSLLSPIFSGDIAADAILPAVVLVQRFLFGVAGALALCVMAWRTARIESTQSATGILYIALIAALVGELASRYLLFDARLPL